MRKNPVHRKLEDTDEKKKMKMTQTYRKIYYVLGLKESILLKWPY